MPGGLAQTPVTLDPATGHYRAGGRAVRVRDVLVDTSIPVAGEPIAADQRKGLVLLRVNGPLRARYVTSGIYGAAWSGKAATYRRYDCSRRPARGRVGQRSRASSTGRSWSRRTSSGRLVGRACVPPTGDDDAACSAAPCRGGSCLVSFRVARTRVPARVQPGATDTRALGARFVGFSVAKPT